MNRIFKPALVVMAVLLVSGLPLGARSGRTSASEKDIADIAKRIYPSVVRVEAQNHTRRVATGVVIDKDGSIVTTALMSPRDEKITVTTSDGKTYDAQFLGLDTETQLAVLRVKDKGLQALALGKSGELAPGSWVCVLGISPERTPSITQGIVSSAAEDRLRLNIWVTPGSSGGPVVDDKGQMVGLLRGVYTEEKPVVFQFRDREQSGAGYVFSRAEAPSSGMAIATPISVVRNVAAQIREKGKVERGWLGVGVNFNESGKIFIVQVDPESPAELAKLREGDIILKFDAKDITSPDILGAEVRKRKPGQDVTLKIERDGKPADVGVKLGEYSEDEAIREMELRFPAIFPPMAPEAAGNKAQPGGPGQPRPSKGPASQKVAPPPAYSFETRKYIGANCNDLNPELAAYFGIKDGTGIIIAKLTEGGPAEKANLKVGDVIVRVDGKRVESRNDLIDIIQDKKKGDKVKVEFIRDKKTMTLDVAVEEEETGGGVFSSGDFRGFLESWQGYTDAFQNEIRKWENDYAPELRANMKKINIKPHLKKV
ncbi:MAG: PDZ domain-containing protein [Candidatus Aminicenantales bacterium]